jgi:hypothetical protein
MDFPEEPQTINFWAAKFPSELLKSCNNQICQRSIAKTDGLVIKDFFQKDCPLDISFIFPLGRSQGY